MKKYDYLHYAGLALVSHIAQGAAFIFLLFVAAHDMTSSFTFRSSYGLALGVLITAALSFGFGWGLRPKAPLPKNICWNSAMALYVLNAAAFLLAPEPFAGGFASMAGTVWSFPIIPALTGAEGVIGGTGAAYLFLGALLAAVEPLCFTLGMTCGGAARERAIPSQTETTENKENEPHA